MTAPEVVAASAGAAMLDSSYDVTIEGLNRLAIGERRIGKLLFHVEYWFDRSGLQRIRFDLRTSRRWKSANKSCGQLQAYAIARYGPPDRVVDAEQSRWADAADGNDVYLYHYLVVSPRPIQCVLILQRPGTKPPVW